MRLLKNDDRFVHGYLNYSKRVTTDPLVPLGPTYEGTFKVWPVEISEDGKRVGVSYTAPGEDD